MLFRSANETADIAKLDAIKTAATAAVALEGISIDTLEVTETTVVANKGEDSETDILADADFLTYYGATSYDPNLKCETANWDGSKWILIQPSN